MDPLSSASRVSASGLFAQSMRIKVVTENLANSQSTGSTPGAEPYQRKLITFSPQRSGLSSMVDIRSIERDNAPFRLEQHPGHPAADENGYVKMPNVDALIEIADMKDATRAYQANLQAIRQVREIVSMTLDVMRS
jgi:flagellar basal-body rod protein FlgC